MTTGDFDPSVQLPVMESFYTIQGEGRNSGRAAYFIRLAGCDVGCVWCDVKESWDPEVHPLIDLKQLVEDAVTSGTELVVITGGEPAMYNLSYLIESLQENLKQLDAQIKALWKKIKEHVNANKNDVIITAGSGMTTVINKLQRILGLKICGQLSNRPCLSKSERPVVFITHMEHHSNHTSWYETCAEILF